MRVILLCSQAFDVPVQRTTSGIRLLLAPEAGGQNGDTYPDLELCTALFSPALAAITNAGHRRTNQMQEPHIDHSVSSSHMTSLQQGFRKKGGRANHAHSDAHDCMSSVLLSLSVSFSCSHTQWHLALNLFLLLSFPPLCSTAQLSTDSLVSGEACLCFDTAESCYKLI